MTALLQYWKVALLAVLLAALGAQTLRLNHAKTEYAEFQTAVITQARKAAELRAVEERTAREEEQRRLAEKDRNVEQARAETEMAARTAAAADRVAAGLRQQVTRLTGAIRQTARNPEPASGSTAADSAVDLLALLYASTDDRAGQLAAEADRRRIAGLSCERAYDSLDAAPH